MHLDITKDERHLLLRGLYAVTPMHDPEVKALANRLMELHENGVAQGRIPSETPVAAKSPASETPRPAPTPSAMSYMSTSKYDRSLVEAITITPTIIERAKGANGPYLLVSWTGPGRGLLKASVWDEDLFPRVLPRLKQESVFYVVRKGKYLNVVGVKG